MMSQSGNVAILGSGIAGIAAGYKLKQRGGYPVIYEQDTDWGGLCGYFSIDGFRFDRFVHLSFAPDEEMAQRFNDSSPVYAHPPEARNYYNGLWLKHPVQDNLANLPTADKVKIVEDFLRKPSPGGEKNYAEWLERRYGKTFSEIFPFAYTKKYWRRDPSQLETNWVGERMHTPSLEELLTGAFEEQKKNFYYVQRMNYPQKGGFRSILDTSRNGLDVQFRKKVVEIKPLEKILTFEDGSTAHYGALISSLPLTVMADIVVGASSDVREAAKKLRHTCGYIVSLGFKRDDVAKVLWFYIYD